MSLGQVETTRVGRWWRWVAYAPPYAYQCAKGLRLTRRAAERAGKKALEDWQTRRVTNV